MTLSIARQLKKAGFPQEKNGRGMWYLINKGMIGKEITIVKQEDLPGELGSKQEILKAPDVMEIVEAFREGQGEAEEAIALLWVKFTKTKWGVK